MKKNYLLFHAHCADGFTSAWAFWKRYGDALEYCPVFHGNPPPEMEPGAKVFIADFSYSRAVLLKLRERHPDLVLLDHHVTAQAELEGLDFATFDMNKSGAVLSWEYCHPGVPLPRLSRYVQDRDLWKWELPHSREIDAVVGLTPKVFAAWDELAARLESDFDGLVAIGRSVLQNNRELVDTMCAYATTILFAGQQVPCVNTPVLHSEAGNELLVRHPDAPFSVTWFQDHDGSFKVSFRSRGDFDVAKLARTLGGGGHRAASGCRLSGIPGTPGFCG